MDILSNLKPQKGSIKNRKRVARGEGSTRGGQATRGMNGQKSRRGYTYRAWFEGGQMPLQRRVPKRGFTNIFRINYQPINLSKLQNLADDGKIENDMVTPVVLQKNGIISKVTSPYKILGDGELTAKLTVEAYKYSKTAQEKIEKAGGTIKEIKL